MKKCNINFLKLSNYLFIILLSFVSLSKFYELYIKFKSKGFAITAIKIFISIIVFIFVTSAIITFAIFMMNFIEHKFSKGMLPKAFLCSFMVMFNFIALILFKIENIFIVCFCITFTINIYCYLKDS